MPGEPFSLFELLGQLLILTRWSNAAYVLNEVKNPVRTLKIAGPLGLSVCGTLYIFANIAYFSASTPAELSKSGVTVASAFMGKVFGEAGQRALR
jgi:amino acid transporter